jgi:Ni/Co efflux regulator RcnB
VDKNGTKIIKLFLIRIFLFLFLLLLPLAFLQAQTRKVKQAERRQEQQKQKEKKEYDQKRQAALKHRHDIQTKEVKARMKETKKRSDHYNQGKKEPFYKGLFNGKKKKRKRRR